MIAHTDLIAVLERLDAPSRGMDAEITCAAEGHRYICTDGAGRVFFNVEGVGRPVWRSLKDIPAYTASIDGALLLVPEGHALELAACPEMGVAVRVYRGPIRENSAGAPSGSHRESPPIAICTAALKARELLDGGV